MPIAVTRISRGMQRSELLFLLKTYMFFRGTDTPTRQSLVHSIISVRRDTLHTFHLPTFEGVHRSVGLYFMAVVLLAGTVGDVRSQSMVIRPQVANASRQDRPRVGLALSGGGARGVAQIGVLRALERHNIPVDFVAATSLGAIIGGLYAAGYSTTELESIAVTTNWDEVLSLTEETKRTERFVDQKLADDRSFLVVRFEGLEPVIPPAVSSGQRFTNFLNTLTLQAVYHPNPSFDHLRIPFRAVSTDLISGNRIVLSEGSLAEALRASATVPLVFNPIDKDGMLLVDGGLLSNIPVDVVRNSGCDLVIAVNSTSGLREEAELKAPWQTADQIMGIMMQLPNRLELNQADIVLTPDVGKHLASDFSGIDTLIARGERCVEAHIGDILRLYQERIPVDVRDTIHIGRGVLVEKEGEGITDSLWNIIKERGASGVLTIGEIRKQLTTLYNSGDFEEMSAELFPESLPDAVTQSGSRQARVVYRMKQHTRLNSVELIGCKVIPCEELLEEFHAMFDKPMNFRNEERALENVVHRYREQGYSLARVESTKFDERSGTLRLVMNEGVISKIQIEGGIRTQDFFVLREFPLHTGDVFEIEKANQGITNINSTSLFEYVYLEVAYNDRQPVLTIRLKERPSQLIRLGLRADNERNFQASIDIRDENFRGSGLELGVSLAGGGRNKEVILEHKANQIFDTYLAFNIRALYSVFDTYVYDDALQTDPGRWERVRVGEYREIRYGGRLVFGAQLERLGNATVELLLQNIRIKNFENLESLEERYRLSQVRFGTVVDSKDSYPFPRSGIGINFSYEFAFKGLGSQVGYNALRFSYESYSTWGDLHTFHPKVTLGFADRTMPLSEQFRLGGRESFFGTNEDDRRGRQLLLFNLEYRYQLPFRLLFDSYVSIRYDLGTISTIPEEIKFSTFRHGIGTELRIDTPIGLAAFGVGKSFYFSETRPRNPVQQGPFGLYFMIGYEL